MDGPIGPVHPCIGGIVLTAVAAAPWAYGPGIGFPFFLLFPLFWLVVIVVLAILFRRAARRRWEAYGGPAAGPHRSPEATLSERFANGEIDEVEYRSRLEVLRSNRPVRR
ncbi:SHOCT domain-containing protein [uncultured Amnibacterium sp.]|uniref:SHOCT domain-containing protein n=1 Tax=uncultured Amnibacterium sp. TaxID=1631851 RepID=UPI0035C96D18